VNFKVCLPAKYIPDNTTVQKTVGGQSYTLKRTLRIYGEKLQELTSQETVYLISSAGSINAYPETREFFVELGVGQLRDIEDSLESHT